MVHKYHRKVVFEIFTSSSSLIIIHLLCVLVCVPRVGSLSSHFLSIHERSSQTYRPAVVHPHVPGSLVCSNICKKKMDKVAIQPEQDREHQLLALLLEEGGAAHLMARLSFSYVILLLFFFFPHSWATASDFRNLKMPSERSSHLISPGFLSGLRRISRMNSHKWVPLGSDGKQDTMA